MSARMIALACLGLIACECGGSGVDLVKDEFTVEPGALEFEAGFIGFQRRLTVSVTNRSRASLVLEASVHGDDTFTVASPTLTVAGGARVDVPVSFAPS